MNEEELLKQKKVEPEQLNPNPQEQIEGEELGETSTPVVEELNSSPQPAEVEPTEEETEPVLLEEESTEEISVEPEQLVSEQPVPEREVTMVDNEGEQTFTQSQVNDLIGKVRQETRDRTFKYVYDRYGVEDEVGMDELVGNAQRFDSLEDEYSNFKKEAKLASDTREAELGEIKEKLAMMESGIDKERYDDAKFILKGKGLPVTLDSILAELNTHPEWKKSTTNFENPELAHTFEAAPGPIGPNPAAEKEGAPSKLSVPVLGNDASVPTTDTEEERAMRMFKLPN